MPVGASASVGAYLHVPQTHAAAVPARSVDGGRVSLPVHDGSIDDEHGAVVSARVPDGADLLVRGGEEDRRLDDVLRARTEGQGVAWPGRVEESVQTVGERVEWTGGLAVCACVEDVVIPAEGAV